MRVFRVVLLTAIFVTGFASPSSAVTVKSVPSPNQMAAQKTSVQPQDKLFGVMDDNPVMSAAAQSGFGVVKRTVWIGPTNNSWETTGKGFVPIPDQYREVITRDMADARAAGIKVILELYLVRQFGPPRGPNQMRGTCAVAKDLLDKFPETYGIEIGVEPNSHNFWWPQFNADGTQASAAPYEEWLAKCYDAIKGTHPDVLVIGGSLSSRGEDQPHKKGSDTSPVLWLQKFCEAYKTSGRTAPVMDWFDMHSYPDPEDQDPTVQHPYPSTTITIADYDKLNGLLGCFSGTAQPKPPILWGETGYNTEVPAAMVGKNYSTEPKPSTVRLIDESTQGRYAATQIKMAYCQSNSAGWLNFHFVDDANRFQDWQSGFAYAPAHPKRGKSSAAQSFTLKQSITPVRKELSAAASGTIDCETPGLP